MQKATTAVKKALIIAAGQGSRINHIQNGRPKQLIPVLGVPLIERVIKLAKQAGVREFYIVVGYRGEEIKEFLGDGSKWNVKIHFIDNEEWQKGNGTSVLKAKDVLGKNGERFFLMMSDHLFDPRILAKLGEYDGDRAVVLAVDRREPTDDDTRVLEKNGYIVNIGKNIPESNCIDTGLFYCDSRLFDYLEDAVKEGKYELSAGILKAASDGEAVVMNITEIDTYNSKLRKEVPPWWIDIDTPEDLKKAKKIIVENASKNPSDLLATYIHKPIENRLVRVLARTGITPNGVTVIVNILAYTVTALYILGYVLYGVILAFIVGIVDGLDGKLARVKMKTTKVGSLEHSFDLLFEFSWLIALAWSMSALVGNIYPMLFAAMSVVLIAFYRSIYDQFRKGAGKSLDDSGKFERKFRRIAGRRNLYNIPILICALLNVPWYSLYIIWFHALITAIVYASRAIHHLRKLDRAEGN